MNCPGKVWTKADSLELVLGRTKDAQDLIRSCVLLPTVVAELELIGITGMKVNSPSTGWDF